MADSQGGRYHVPDCPMKKYSIKDVAPTVSAILGLRSPAQSTGAVIQQIVRDLSDRQRVAVLVPDALGLFPFQRWRDEMPYLSSLHDKHSIVMRSVLPSVTPVCFSAILTGAEQSVHGVDARTDTIACETLFDTVGQSEGQTAGVGLRGHTGYEFVGRHAGIRGDGGDGSDAGTEAEVIRIVDQHSPAFVIAQLYWTDGIFHKYGPSSPAVVPILQETDSRIDRLCRYLGDQGYGVIVLADHGQHDLPDAGEGENKGRHGTDADEDLLVPCTWV